MSEIPEVLRDITDSEAGKWPKFILEEEDKIVHTHTWETSWRIERHGLNNYSEDFSEDWTDVYTGPCYADIAYVYHNSSPIYSRKIVIVDSAQAIIPLPEEVDGEYKISKLLEQIGAILTENTAEFYDKLDEADIEITEDRIRSPK